MENVIVIPIHGMGIKPPGYSQDWLKILNKSKVVKTNNIVWKEFTWDHLNDDNVAGLQNAIDNVKSVPLLFKPLNWIVSSGLDVLYYRYHKAQKKAVWDLRYFVNKIAAEDEEAQIVILAHSLGSALMYDALSDILKNQPSYLNNDRITLVTFGSPLTSTFQRLFLMIDVKKIFPKLWVNLSGKRDPVGGSNMSLPSFNKKNQIWYDVAHHEFQYLESFKDTFWKLINTLPRGVL